LRQRCVADSGQQGSCCGNPAQEFAPVEAD